MTPTERIKHHSGQFHHIFEACESQGARPGEFDEILNKIHRFFLLVDLLQHCILLQPDLFQDRDLTEVQSWIKHVKSIIYPAVLKEDPPQTPTTLDDNRIAHDKVTEGLGQITRNVLANSYVLPEGIDDELCSNVHNIFMQARTIKPLADL